MPSEKKDSVNLTMRVDRGVMKLFTDYCQSSGQTKTKAFERLVVRSFDGSPVKVPTPPEVDFMKIAEAVGKEDVYEDWDPVTLFRAEKIIMDAIFNAYTRGKYKVKDYPQKNVKVYEFKKFECYLAVYLQEGNVSYTIRLNTLNSMGQDNQASVLYFSVDHMDYYVHSLLYRMLNDFSRILSRCVELKYTPEGNYKDTVPRGCCIDQNTPFCSEREKELLFPCHYYSGYMDENKKYVELPFDEWLEETRNKYTK